MNKIYKYNFISKFKTANILSFFLVLASLALIFFKGLNFGIDFKGGTLIELRVDSENIKISDVRSSFSNMNLGDLNVKEFGKKGDYLVKFEKKKFDNEINIKKIKENVKNKLSSDVNFRRIENVGPKVSAELLSSGLLAISLALGAMLFYIWVRFEWQFSLGSIAAIFHDVLITVGIFSLLSLEVNLSIVAAVLTIVGYSMNDTVVIYDRIRENLSKFSKSKIEEIANTSINETLSRTIITSGTTLLALISIFVLGGEILKGFSFAMIIGVVIGTYSSIFVAAPILKYLNVSYKSIAKEKEDN
ncbi:MAG: protein translocase subunit SecF [Pelagibacteraceae bacterium TMED124]|nr:MAG: protein translocase subunit SecF [Pelagibacteraceae bacterium TMED124]|tara:strand:- start:2105 stop:3013 length:909 start_codon:yes stop_codon:yes gene_type:complete